MNTFTETPDTRGTGEPYPYAVAATNEHGEVDGEYVGALEYHLAQQSMAHWAFGGMVARWSVERECWEYNWGGGWADTEGAAVELVETPEGC